MGLLLVAYIINAACKVVVIAYCTVVTRNTSSSSSSSPCKILAKEQSFDLRRCLPLFASDRNPTVVTFQSRTRAGLEPRHWHRSAMVSSGRATIRTARSKRAFPDCARRFIDPVVAILLSIYIATSWMSDAREHICRLGEFTRSVLSRCPALTSWL